MEVRLREESQVKHSLFVLSVGPFVMTSEEELQETRKDYQYGRNGFENAHSWNSFIVTEDDTYWMFILLYS